MGLLKRCKKQCSNYMKKGCRLLFVEKKRALLMENAMFATEYILNWTKIKKYEAESCEKFEQN